MLRRKMLFALVGLGLAAPGVCADPANDLGVITVTVNDHASLLVADEEGHLTGVDPTTPKMYQEIPESNGGDVPAAHTVSIYHPRGAAYQVFVMGMNSGAYKLELAAYSKDGTPQPKIALDGNATPGDKTIYDITYNPDWSSGSDASTMVLHP